MGVLVEFVPARIDFVFSSTNCPWVSKDEHSLTSYFQHNLETESLKIDDILRSGHKRYDLIVKTFKRRQKNFLAKFGRCCLQKDLQGRGGGEEWRRG